MLPDAIGRDETCRTVPRLIRFAANMNHPELVRKTGTEIIYFFSEQHLGGTADSIEKCDRNIQVACRHFPDHGPDGCNPAAACNSDDIPCIPQGIVIKCAMRTRGFHG